MSEKQTTWLLPPALYSAEEQNRGYGLKMAEPKTQLFKKTLIVDQAKRKNSA